MVLNMQCGLRSFSVQQQCLVPISTCSCIHSARPHPVTSTSISMRRGEKQNTILFMTNLSPVCCNFMKIGVLITILERCVHGSLLILEDVVQTNLSLFDTWSLFAIIKLWLSFSSFFQLYTCCC